ncbi:hypothetical protein R52603_03188 [Paraburkholderia saeva]|uniref:Uncharacterized protein n=1 Tax=Paraburkholderia saeva TaxID=2777537 RepID=A0A9N8S0Z7_9BURK|nr:hypothetical protein R70241_00736 [Paraburkholderia saeva]CAG4904301.1 hypothetical protein R52603_03188 [Paraburkholderia saeva]CAG4915274.1 hypothetical protein LMG31841_04460 [Paraburkholderia saeva]
MFCNASMSILPPRNGVTMGNQIAEYMITVRPELCCVA